MGRDLGKAMLREAQWDSAVKGKDPRMLVWMGKQMLDQRDKKDKEDGDTNVEVQVVVVGDKRFEFK
jgi:hypothetical protein